MRCSLRRTSASTGAAGSGLEDGRLARRGTHPLGRFFLYPSETPAEELVFLAELHDEEWMRVIDYAERRRFRRGDVIVHAGEVDRSLGIVVEGTLDLFLTEDEKPFLSIGAHSIVGEMAFIDARPRSATIRARTDGELLRLTFAAFEVLAARHPVLGRAILLDLGRILAIRLERADRELARHPR